MQIVLRCKHCGKMSVSDHSSDTCLEIDAYEQEIRFVCRQEGCHQPNTLKIGLSKGEKAVSRQIHPGVAFARG